MASSNQESAHQLSLTPTHLFMRPLLFTFHALGWSQASPRPQSGCDKVNDCPVSMFAYPSPLMYPGLEELRTATELCVSPPQTMTQMSFEKALVGGLPIKGNSNGCRISANN